MGLCCKLFSCLISFIFTLGVIALVLYLVVRPSEIKSYVELSSQLTQFDLTNNNTLDYNLTVDLSIRNPNKRVSIYYDRVQASASYDGFRFGFDDNLPEFHQGHKNTTTIHPTFRGQQIISNPTLVDTYNKEKSEGYFNIDITLDSKVRYKALAFKIGTYKRKIKCSVKFPAPNSNYTGAEFFKVTDCHVNFF